MFSIEQSAFLHALGRAIGHSLWQVASLWLFYTALTNTGKWSANRKYQLATAASLTGLVLFIGTLLYFYISTPLYTYLQTTDVYQYTPATESASTIPELILFVYHSVIKSLHTLAPYISCAYLLMAMLLGIRLHNAFRQVHLFSTQGLEKANVEWRLFVQHYASALGINRKVRIFTSHYVEGPLTLGFWKPIILMPAASLTNLTTSQVESILLHELAHIRRYDYLLNIILQIAEITLFFNPFMRLLLKQVKMERENSCDDYVLQFQYCPKDYAKALLAIEHNNHTAMLALAAKGNQSFQLLNRVKRMVAPQAKSFNYRQQLGVLLLFTILLVGFTVIIPHPRKNVKQPVVSVVASSPAKTLQEAPINIVEETAPDSYEPATVSGYDFVKRIINYPKLNIQVDEDALQAEAEKIALDGAELEALGKTVDEKMKPVTAKLEAIGKRWEAAQASSNQQQIELLIREMKNLPLDAITQLGQTYQQKLMGKLDSWGRLIPGFRLQKSTDFSMPATAYNQVTNNAEEVNTDDETIVNSNDSDDENEEGITTSALFDSDLQKKLVDLQRQANIIAKQAGRNAERMIKRQAERLEKAHREQQAADERSQHLHLGLLTDDRDTTLMNAQKLLAKAQSKHKANFSFNYDLPAIPTVQVANKKVKGKCVISFTDDDIKFSSEDIDAAIQNSLHINVPNVDVQHQKQMKNGKQEDVVTISISSSK